MKDLLNALVECKSTLKSVDISDNKSINKAIPELLNMISVCQENLIHINISDLNMKPKHIKTVADAIVSLWSDKSNQCSL